MTGFGALEVNGPSAQPFPISRAVMSIGRAPENDLCLDDPTVSRFHARLSADAAGVRLRDLGSANGTTLDGFELEPKADQTLTDGALICIGPYELRYRAPSAGRPSDAAGSTGSPVAGAPLRPTVVVGASALPRLALHTEQGDREVPLRGTALRIGRDPDNDIVISAPAVSRHHARLEPQQDGYRLIDLGSTNGLTVDGMRVDTVTLQPERPVQIGTSVTLTLREADVIRPRAAVMAPPAGSGSAVTQLVRLPAEGELRIGRAADAQLPLDHPRVSNDHATISGHAGRYVLTDNASSSGTFVNDRAVSEQELRDGDVVRIGGHRLVVRGDHLELTETTGGFGLDAFGLSVVVGKGKRILDDVSLSIRPQEFVAIVGGSGSGKSTLLKALCAFRPASDGVVLLGGVDLYEHYEAYRSELGYVPQDDIVHRELPVTSELGYAARLRMPRDTTRAERDQRVREVLDELTLTEQASTTVRALSGGQRKRVSIGVELLTRPGTFFLDEATSGLDPGTESQMMRLLRGLADQGRTVVLVTHATKNVMTCDKVVFLARGGRLAYFGPPEEALSYFGVSDFDEIYAALETGNPDDWAERFRRSPLYVEHVVTPLSNSRPPSGGGAQGTGGRPLPPPTTGQGLGAALSQFVVLTQRYIDTMRRDRRTALLLLAISPVLGALDFVLWHRNVLDPVTGDMHRTMTLLFVVVVISMLVGSITSVRELVKEAAIYRRERMVGLQLVPYVCSKVVVGFAFAAYSAVMLFAFKILALDVSTISTRGLLQLLVTITIGTFSGVLLGLAVSAVAPTEERAMLLVILVLVPEIVFAGAMVPFKDLGPVGNLVGVTMSSRWQFGAMVTAAAVRTGPCVAPDLSDCSMPGMATMASDQRRALVLQIDRQYDQIFHVDVTAYWVVSLVIAFALFGLIIVLQSRRDRR